MANPNIVFRIIYICPNCGENANNMNVLEDEYHNPTLEQMLRGEFSAPFCFQLRQCTCGIIHSCFDLLKDVEKV